MPYDVYERLKLLEGRLSAEGFEHLANELKRAVKYGYTGTEIHMNVRGVLNEFSATRPQLEPDTRDLIAEIVTHIDTVLDEASG